MTDHTDIDESAAGELLARFDAEAPVDDTRVDELLDKADRGEGRGVGDDFAEFRAQGKAWHDRHRAKSALLRAKAH